MKLTIHSQIACFFLNGSRWFFQISELLSRQMGHFDSWLNHTMDLAGSAFLGGQGEGEQCKDRIAKGLGWLPWIHKMLGIFVGNSRKTGEFIYGDGSKWKT